MKPIKIIPKLQLPSLSILAVVGSILGGVAVAHTHLVNRSISLEAQMAETNKRIKQHQIATDSYRTDIDQMLGYVSLKERLESMESEMVPVDPGLMERYLPDGLDELSRNEAVASR